MLNHRSAYILLICFTLISKNISKILRTAWERWRRIRNTFLISLFSSLRANYFDFLLQMFQSTLYLLYILFLSKNLSLTLILSEIWKPCIFLEKNRFFGHTDWPVGFFWEIFSSVSFFGYVAWCGVKKRDTKKNSGLYPLFWIVKFSVK